MCSSAEGWKPKRQQVKRAFVLSAAQMVCLSACWAERHFGVQDHWSRLVVDRAATNESGIGCGSDFLIVGIIEKGCFGVSID